MNTKTIEELERIKAAVLAECERVCEKGTHIFRIGGGVYIHRYTKRKVALMLEHDDGHDSIATVNLDGPCQNLELFHKALGLKARDAANEVSDFLYIDINRLKDELKDSEARATKLVEAETERMTTAVLEAKNEAMIARLGANKLVEALEEILAIESKFAWQSMGKARKFAKEALAAHKEGGAQG